MNTYRNCLLTMAICATVSFSNLAAAAVSSDAKASKPNKSTPSKLVDHESRFGRNVRTDVAKPLGRNRICKAPSAICKCKMVSSRVSCEVKFLKRR